MMRSNLCAHQVTRTFAHLPPPQHHVGSRIHGHQWGCYPAPAQRGVKDQQKEVTRLKPLTFFCGNNYDETPKYHPPPAA